MSMQSLLLHLHAWLVYEIYFGCDWDLQCHEDSFISAQIIRPPLWLCFNCVLCCCINQQVSVYKLIGCYQKMSVRVGKSPKAPPSRIRVVIVWLHFCDARWPRTTAMSSWEICEEAESSAICVTEASAQHATSEPPINILLQTDASSSTTQYYWPCLNLNFRAPESSAEAEWLWIKRQNHLASSRVPLQVWC